jgi:hypothetical protein
VGKTESFSPAQEGEIGLNNGDTVSPVFIVMVIVVVFAH